MAGWKVGCVQERHVGVEVRRFDPEDEAVRVSETVEDRHRNAAAAVCSRRCT